MDTKHVPAYVLEFDGVDEEECVKKLLEYIMHNRLILPTFHSAYFLYGWGGSSRTTLTVTVEGKQEKTTDV